MPGKHALNTVADAQSGNRLGRDDWIEAALAMLGEQGIDGVRVERLAQVLKVTKGSFYWHFKDRDDLCSAMLETWRRESIDRSEEYIAATEDPRRRLGEMLAVPFGADISGAAADLSLSVRLWARNDPRPRAAIREVDQSRLRLIARLLEACGVPEDEARPRSVLLYAYVVAAAMLVDPDDMALRAQCEALLTGVPAPPP